MTPEQAAYGPVAEFRTALRRFLRESEEVLRGHGLTPAWYDLLVMVAASGGEGATINELAARLALAPNSVTELVDRAQEAALVERYEDAHDRRVTRVVLTATGSARVAAAVAALRPQRMELLRLLGALEVRSREEPP